MMPDDKLTPAQRIRLESVAQANLAMQTMPRHINATFEYPTAVAALLADAAEIERYITGAES
jgi:hypothetical protein